MERNAPSNILQGIVAVVNDNKGRAVFVSVKPDDEPFPQLIRFRYDDDEALAQRASHLEAGQRVSVSFEGEPGYGLHLAGRGLR